MIVYFFKTILSLNYHSTFTYSWIACNLSLIFVWIVLNLLLQILGFFLNALFLGHALTIMLVYVWARRNPYIRLGFFGLVNFQVSEDKS